MLKSPFLIAISVLVMLMQWAGSARAQEHSLGLSFELPPPHNQSIVKQSESKIPIELPAVEPLAPAKQSVVEIASTLPLQSVSGEPTLSLESAKKEYEKEDLPPIESPSDTTQRQPQADNVEIAASEEIEIENRSDIGLTFAAHNISEETLADETVDAQAEPADLLSGDSLQSFSLERSQFETSRSDQLETSRSADEQSESVAAGSPALLFADTNIEVPELTEQSSSESQPFSVSAMGLGDWIFENGTESLVARTVGSAEGTRHWDGRKTQAYYGHVDPGNGVWNLGTFSYQHDAQDPADADEKQLRRLQRQGTELEAQARKFGIQLSLEEKLNGLDLANQAPLAALDKGGYIERLAQAHRLQMNGDEAILWARTHSYMDPDTRRWNAPGLGNNVNSISKDQERRIHAIAKALTAFEPAGSSSVALEHLEEITLENTGIATKPEGDRDALASGDSLAFSNVAVSFGLPPADQALIAAISTPAEPVASTLEPASEVESQAIIAVAPVTAAVTQIEPVTRTEAITPPESKEATPTAPANSPQTIGVDFLASDDIALSYTNERLEEQNNIVVDTPETLVGETIEPTQPANGDAPTETVSEGNSNNDLFSLQANETEDVTPTVPGNETEEVATTTPGEVNRLQSLLNGIIPRNQATADTTEATDTPLEANPSFWRTEDKIVDEK